MEGNVTVLDIGPANNFASVTNPGETQSYIYAPGTAYNPSQINTNPGIVPTPYQVQLSYASFAQFTSTTPSGATGPTLADNPIIGPNPVAAFNGTPQANAPPGVGISYDGKSATGSFLLDTGAQASFISQAMAAQLGVQYEAGTYGTANPILISTATGQAIPGQFTISASGAGGGTVTSAGFYLSTLSLQTKQGTTINFDGAPVAVQDVTVTDSATGKSLTLAGDLGMNFFEPSATTNFGSIDGSAFNWMTINQPAGLLGLTPSPEAPSGPLLGAALALLLMCCRWPRCRPTIPAR